MYAPLQFEWIDKLTADEVAAAHGVSRATVFRWKQLGRLGPMDWSRAALSRHRSHAPGSYLRLLEWLMRRAIQIHGREYVASILNIHFPDVVPQPVQPTKE